MGAGSYLSSNLLALRRRQVAFEEAQAAGLILPKRAFNHVGINWAGPWRWTCSTCGQSGGDPSASPGLTPCAWDTNAGTRGDAV